MAADSLAKLIQEAADTNSAEAWQRLLMFPFAALSVSSRGVGSGDTSLTTKMKHQIAAYMESEIKEESLRLKTAVSQDARAHDRSIHDKSTHRQPAELAKTTERLKKNVTQKIADGDVKGAIRLLASENEIAQDSPDVTESLQSKHPDSPTDLNLPPGPDDSTQSCLATEADVTAEIASFDPGSSAGLDGLRPAHLKDLTGRSAGEAGPRLTSALTRLVNLALRGEVPSLACAAFYGASLIALRKPCGGVRPIAIGSTYRRLATKVALRPLGALLGEELRPIQLGFGTSGGCEAAAHAARQYTGSLDQDSVVVKIDMRNAFNSVRRDHFLRQVREHAPSLYPLLWQAYSKPTPLYHGTSKIWSATGLQQGDPCGPAVFSLAIHPVASAVTSPFNCWYLDDGILGGNINDIINDLEQLVPRLAQIGLEVNPSKCEIILPKNIGGAEECGSTVDKIHKVTPGASVLEDAEQTVLGAPLTGPAAMTVLGKKKKELNRMINRLRLLDDHSAFFLLRNCLWLPRLQYLLRATPLYQQPDLLKNLDDDLKTAAVDILNVSFDKTSWEQAVLPSRLGGLGLRRTADVALPSFISSLHRGQQLLCSILPGSLAASVAAEREEAAADWQAKAGNKEVPNDDVSHLQKAWDSPLAECQRDALLTEANQFGRARLLNAATSESGAWLHALPSASLGTLLDNETVRIAIALRVGADVCHAHYCKCGALADSKGYHSLTCRFSAGRFPRHTALNDIVRRALQSAGVPALLEPHGVDRGDGKRPDGMTIFPFSQGRSLVWDATCINSFADSHLAAAATKAGAAAHNAELAKRRKYVELVKRFRFEPVAFETGGACGPSTKVFLRELGSRLTAVTGERRETEWLLQRCSFAVIRGNAASILLTTAAPTTEHAAACPPESCLSFTRKPASPHHRQHNAVQMNPTTAPRELDKMPHSLGVTSAPAATEISPPPHEHFATNGGRNGSNGGGKSRGSLDKDLPLDFCIDLEETPTEPTPNTSSGPRRDPLSAYRVMFTEMSAGAARHPVPAARHPAAMSGAVLQLLNPRDPLADPDLARYLLPACRQLCRRRSRSAVGVVPRSERPGSAPHH